jgi:hypothetical protein
MAAPTPYPCEWIDSYIRRFAERYEVSIKTSCRNGLGGDIDLDTFTDDPDRAVLLRLSSGTGAADATEKHESTAIRAPIEDRAVYSCRDYPKMIQKWPSGV